MNLITVFIFTICLHICLEYLNVHVFVSEKNLIVFTSRGMSVSLSSLSRATRDSDSSCSRRAASKLSVLFSRVVTTSLTC